MRSHAAALAFRHMSNVCTSQMIGWEGGLQNSVIFVNENENGEKRQNN